MIGQAGGECGHRRAHGRITRSASPPEGHQVTAGRHRIVHLLLRDSRGQLSAEYPAPAPATATRARALTLTLTLALTLARSTRRKRDAMLLEAVSELRHGRLTVSRRGGN